MTNELRTLSIEERADLLGVSAEEFLGILNRTRSCVASAMFCTAGSIARQRRWLDLGCPPGDLADLFLRGGSWETQRIIRETIDNLPDVARHAAITEVAWFVMQAGPWGLCFQDVDIAHARSLVVIAGDVPPDQLPGLVAHEMGHAFAAPLDRTPRRDRRRPEPRLSWIHRVAAAEGAAAEEDARQAVVDSRCLDELQADALATAWGYPIDTCGDWRRRSIAEEVAADLRIAAAAMLPPKESP